MARFFKYHTLDDVTAAGTELGLDLRFSTDLGPLFEPVVFGDLLTGNRFCVQPMEGCDGTPDGEPGELTYRRYHRFGAGGAKLIWGEATAVVPEGRATPRQIWLNERTQPAFARLVRECRAAHREACGDDNDLVIGLQLTHSGRYSHPRPLRARADALLDPRTVMDKATGRAATADDPLLSDDELKRLPDAYAAAARLAHDAGFQFVDVKQCHGYLLNELLGSRTRAGPYGGSLEDRTRLIREIFQAVRAAVPGVVLATRLSVYDAIPFRKGAENVGEPAAGPGPHPDGWGFCLDDWRQPDLTEPLWWVGEMDRLGLTLLNVSMGNPYVVPHVIRPFETPPPDGYESPEHPLIGVDRHFRLTAAVQAAFPDLAIVGSGYSYLQEFLPFAGAANVRDDRTTFVGFGRASLPQPDFVHQLQEHGRLDRKRVCRTFSYCTALMRAKHNALGQFPTGCPPFDKEVYGPIWQECLQVGRR